MALPKRTKAPDDKILRERPPTHPGEILREDILPALKISQRKLAEILRLKPQHLNRILNEEQSITPDTAVRLGAFFDNDPRFWLAMQDSRDVWESRRKLADEIGEIMQVREDLVASLHLKA